MDEEKKEQGKKCFIITPIGNENSDIFRKAKGVIESVIKPILEKYGFDDIKPAYEIMESGMISNQIINRIINDDLVVANLTGNNPNVMYELAIRHGVAKPIIHICEKETGLPFDIKDSRTIFYKDDMLGVQELQRDFDNFVEQTDYSKDYSDNPIFNALKSEFSVRGMNNKLYQKSDVEDMVDSHIKTLMGKCQEFKEKCKTDMINLLNEFDGKFEWIQYKYNDEKYELELDAKFDIKEESFELGNIKFNIQGNIISISEGKLCDIRLGLQKIYKSSVNLDRNHF